MGRAWNSQTNASLHRTSHMEFATNDKVHSSSNGVSGDGSTTYGPTSYHTNRSGGSLSGMVGKGYSNMTFGENSAGDIIEVV